MNLQALLSFAASHGVTLRLEGDQLAVRAPKGVLTPEIRLILAERKEELLSLLRHRASRTTESQIPRQPQPDTDPAPLSSGQERLWFLNRLVPDSPLYNVHVRLLIKGSVDREVLARAFSILIARHGALRTSFPTIQGRPCAVTSPAADFRLPWIELSSSSPEERSRELDRLSRAQRTEPFILSQGPLFRVTLISTGTEEHVLLITQHHIITDAWSLGLLLTELGQLYRALAADQSFSLPELPIRYGDYARWQRAALGQEATQRSREWWREKLAKLPRLELPTSRACVAAPTYAGDARSITISSELTNRLKQLAQQEGCTLFVTLLSAWVILLHRYSHQDDFAVGTVSAGRDRSELQGIHGFFVNTLALRCDISGEPTVKALLQRLREVVETALANDGVPFEEVVKTTGATRGLSLNPLIQALFLFENIPPPSVEIPGTTWSLLPDKPDGSVEGTTKFDVCLMVMEQNGGLHGTIEYATDLFDAATIERMLGHFAVLLLSMVESPEMPIGVLPLLPTAERHQLMEWGQPQALHPQEPCLHALFEMQVKRTPDAVALIHEQQQLTYKELNERANQLAHHLRSLGVGPEDLVGLCVERSVEMVVALLGILKAGGAYVPLDPAYPRERLTFMLADARAKVLLTQRVLLPVLQAHPIPTICLDAEQAAISQQRADDPVSGVAPGNLAYVIYTSGSTGRPKGVEVTHANVVRLFTATEEWFHFGAKDVWALFHSFAFDMSVWELWGALNYGGRLVVVPLEVSRSPKAFHQLLCRERVTVLNQTPSAFRPLVAVDASAAADLGVSLRLVTLAGEPVDLQSLRAWFQRHGDRHPQIVNMYGITETTVHVTYRPLYAADLDGESPSPIGRPIPDLQIYVLDANRQLLPIGVPGELYVGGAGVARGYLNRPELTSERFIEDPFRAGLPHRLYKTGDRGRWQENGDLEYLGRIDQQVKIRGYRIELGEIESALGQHPAIREAVVQAREDVPGDKRLVAYIVPRAEALPRTSELRSYLQDRLPEYMVPTVFVELAALPLTSNGKVDRRALPAPAQERGTDSYVAPQTSLQETVAGIFASVLHLDRVGLHEGFFDLGGHSLLAEEVVIRIAQTFGTSFPLADFYRAPTVAVVADRLSGHPAGIPAPPLEADSVLPPDVQLPARAAARPVRSVLLTGATGFVGAFVLQELLRTPWVRVYCIVRGADVESAGSRLRAALEGWGIEVDWARIHVFPGDLAAPKLGLAQALWEELAEDIDCIVHNGATVHHGQGYDSLRSVNVGGTLETLRLAATGRAKRLCLVSTLSILDTTAAATEETSVAPPWTGSGYVQTKWVAEKLLLAAAERGHDVSICRLGLVLGDTARGRVQIAGYWATQALRACARTSLVPAGLQLSLHPIPVDLAARSIAADALRGSRRRITHIGGREAFTTEVLSGALQALGISCKVIPLMEWVEGVRAAASDDSELQRLLALVESTETEPSLRIGVDSGAALLREMELTQPDLGELLIWNLRYLQERGAL